MGKETTSTKWKALWILLLGTLTVGCGADDSGSQSNGDVVLAQDTTSTDIAADLDVQIPTDTTDASDAETEDVLEEDVVEIATPNCVEEVINPLQVGTRIFYTCVSVGEGPASQQIRTVKKAAKAIQVLVEIQPPERLGQVLQVSGESLYFDTLTLAGGVVAQRNIYRVPVDGGETEEVVLFTALDTGPLDQTVFQAPTRVLVFAPQPGGDRVAFVMGNLTTQTGEGHLYIYDGAEQSFVSEGIVSSFGWGFGGNGMTWISGGNLVLAGVDGSGANVLDPAVFTTGIPPRFLNGSTLVYAGTKKTLRKYTIGVGKEEIPVIFEDDIQFLGIVDATRVFVFASEMSVYDLSDDSSFSLGPISSFSIRYPIAMAPDGSAVLVGGSLDNPFKSFEYRLIQVETGSNLPALTTGAGAGVVSTAIAWQ